VVWLASWATTRTRLVALILGSFGAVLLCAILCGELLGIAERPDGSTAPDSSITSWMVAHRTQGLTTLARALSTLGSQTVLLPLAGAVALALLVRRRFALAALLIAAWGGALLLYNLTKYFVDRPRPPSVIWLTDVGKTTSFPSGHATQSLATFLALGLVGTAWISKPRWPGLLPALVLAGGIGWSRVYLGVHWTSDVLAGWLIAAAWITMVLWLTAIERLIERRQAD
jgi:membrane-associated phospholipid phosphatase